MSVEEYRKNFFAKKNKVYTVIFEKNDSNSLGAFDKYTIKEISNPITNPIEPITDDKVDNNPRITGRSKRQNKKYRLEKEDRIKIVENIRHVIAGGPAEKEYEVDLCQIIWKDGRQFEDTTNYYCWIIDKGIKKVSQYIEPIEESEIPTEDIDTVLPQITLTSNMVTIAELQLSKNQKALIIVKTEKKPIETGLAPKSILEVIISKAETTKVGENVAEWTTADIIKWKAPIIGDPQYIFEFKHQWVHGYRDVIKTAANFFDIPELLLAGVAFIEVGGDPLWIDDVAYLVRSFDHAADPYLEPLTITHEPEKTSFGNVSIQVRRAAESLGYDLEKEEGEKREKLEEVIIAALKDPKQNIFIAAKHLSDLRDLDFSGKKANEMTIEDIEITGRRYNRGPDLSLEKIKDNLNYGKAISRRKQDLIAMIYEIGESASIQDQVFNNLRNIEGDDYQTKINETVLLMYEKSWENARDAELTIEEMLSNVNPRVFEFLSLMSSEFNITSIRITSLYRATSIGNPDSPHLSGRGIDIGSIETSDRGELRFCRQVANDDVTRNCPNSREDAEPSLSQDLCDWIWNNKDDLEVSQIISPWRLIGGRIGNNWIDNVLDEGLQFEHRHHLHITIDIIEDKEDESYSEAPYLFDDSVVMEKGSIDLIGANNYNKQSNVPDNYVYDFQSNLKAFGFKEIGNADGSFGIKTKNALNTFQRVAASGFRKDSNEQHISVNPKFTGAPTSRVDEFTREEIIEWIKYGYSKPDFYGCYQLKKGDKDNTKKWGGIKRESDDGHYIEDLQKDLVKLGYWISDPGHDSGMKIDGIYGNKVYGAVWLFQKEHVIEKTGVVDFDTAIDIHQSSKDLKEEEIYKRPSNFINDEVGEFYQLPPSTFFTHDAPQYSEQNYLIGIWGKKILIECITKTAKEWVTAGNEKFRVGHLSKENDGNFPPHSGHKNGEVADIKSYDFCNLRNIRFNRIKSKDLAEQFFNNGIRQILFNCKYVIDEFATQNNREVCALADHHHHFHINLGEDNIRTHEDQYCINCVQFVNPASERRVLNNQWNKLSEDMTDEEKEEYDTQEKKDEYVKEHSYKCFYENRVNNQ